MDKRNNDFFNSTSLPNIIFPELYTFVHSITKVPLKSTVPSFSPSISPNSGKLDFPKFHNKKGKIKINREIVDIRATIRVKGFTVFQSARERDGR